MAPFHRSGPTFTAMGRFGNVMLINGETEYRADASAGEVVRLHLVNTANTRIFNIAVSGARMKLVGGDSGRDEREEFVDEVLLSPSERAIVDVLFDEPGEARLENRTPDRTYDLGHFIVAGEAAGAAAAAFEELRTDTELERRARADQGGHRARARQDPRLRLADADPLRHDAEQASSYVCPMHPEVTSTEPASVPEVRDEAGACRKRCRRRRWRPRAPRA